MNLFALLCGFVVATSYATRKLQGRDTRFVVNSVAKKNSNSNESCLMVKLLIAMPTQGSINTSTVKSLIGLTQNLRRIGIAFAFETYEFSDIVFSRNQLASIFLTRKVFSHMLMLDSDMIFEPQSIMRLIEFDAPFTAGPYPQKKFFWGKIGADILQIPEDAAVDVKPLLSRNWLYNHQKGMFPGHAFSPQTRNGFRTVPATGTGMMCITREVVEKMAESGAARKLQRMSTIPLHKGLEYHDFFSHIASPSGDFLYAEDQSFCYRWVVECGGDIWMDTQSTYGHEGRFTWTGCWGDQLEAERLAREKPVSTSDEKDDSSSGF